MTEWIDINDLIDEFSAGDANNKELPYTGVDPVTGNVILNESKINNAIVAAREEIESYLKAAGIPTGPTPDSVVTKLKPCIFNLTRFYYSDIDEAMFVTIQKRYDLCIAKMKDIVAGRIVIWEDEENGKFNGGIQQVPLFRG